MSLGTGFKNKRKKETYSRININNGAQAARHSSGAEKVAKKAQNGKNKQKKKGHRSGGKNAT